MRLPLRSERAEADVHTECSGSALYRVASREVVGLHCTALESVESRAMYCTGSREAAQLVEARPQLVVSTAALRHQLVGGGPGSHSFYGVFGVKGTYVHAGFANFLNLMDFRMRLQLWFYQTKSQR